LSLRNQAVGKKRFAGAYRSYYKVFDTMRSYANQNDRRPRARIMLIAPLPPPIHGVSMAVQQILSSSLVHEFSFLPINTGTFRHIGDAGRVRPSKVIGDIAVFCRLLFSLVACKPDIVYLTLAQTRVGIIRDSVIILISKAFGCSVVAHLHGAYFRIQYQKLSALERLFVRIMLAKVDRIIVLSPLLESLFDGLVARERIRIVRNGISDIPPKYIHSHKPNQDVPIRILYLSNLQPEKGLFDLLDALRIARRSGVLFRATLAGAWPNDDIRNEAMRFVYNEGLAEAVSFPGVVIGTDKLALLADADVVVLPFCQEEGQPLSIIEAMRAGLPIISTPVGGVPDLIIHGQNGFLIPKHNSQAIAESLLLLARNPDLRMSMGYASRQRFLDNYKQEFYIAGLRSIFEELLQEKIEADVGGVQ